MLSLIGNAIGAVGSLASGAMQARAVDKYNEGQMNLMHEQNAFNERMTDKMNEYNSPQQQVLRNIKAGLNPLTGLTSGNQGTAVTSADANLQPIDYKGLQEAFNQLGSGVDRYISNLQKRQEIIKLQKENFWYDTQQELDRGLKENEKTLKDYQVRLQEYLNSTPDKTPEELKETPAYRRLMADVEKAEEDVKVSREHAKLSNQAYRFASSMNPKLLSKLDKEIQKIDNENAIGSVQAKLAREFGLTPGDDGLYALIKMGVLHPDSYTKIISGLIGAVGETIKQGGKKALDWLF